MLGGRIPAVSRYNLLADRENDRQKMDNPKHTHLPSGAKQDTRVPAYSLCVLYGKLLFHVYCLVNMAKRATVVFPVYCSIQRGENGILRVYDMQVAS